MIWALQKSTDAEFAAYGIFKIYCNEFPESPLKMNEHGVLEYLDGIFEWHAVIVFFGLTRTMAAKLFSVRSYPANVTREMVIARIQSFIG